MSSTEVIEKSNKVNVETYGSLEELPCVIYSPESLLRSPAKLVLHVLTDLWKARELIWILFMRDLKATHRQSVLRYAWIFIPSLTTTAVWLFLSSQNIVQVADTPIPYPAFVLVGTMLWTTFSSALTQPLVSFNSSKPVFTKLKVPPEAFIAAGMATVLFDFLVRLVLIIPMFFILRIAPPATALLFPVAVICLFLLAAALGIVLVPLGGLYQDIGRAASTLVGFLMYLAPVVYVPPRSGWSATVIRWNPVTPVIMAGRDWLTLGASDYAAAMFLVAGISVVVLLASVLILRVVMPHLVARMGM
jgi:lipopolysaccharide transport system permease protein